MSDPLEHLLSQMPASDAPESEIEAFMEKVVNTPGGSELIEDFAKKMTAGGSLDMMLKTEALREEERVLTSPARFIFRIELLRTTPLIWRRLSLPADCDYAHLSLAIQDAFGWEGSRPDRFEVWENGRLELSFDHGETETSFDQVGNKLLDIFQENVSEFRYFYGQESEWAHRVIIENFVKAGLSGTCETNKPQLHTGERHSPPEDCGGPLGFSEFLKREHPLCEKYEPSVLLEFSNGQPDFSKITFR